MARDFIDNTSRLPPPHGWRPQTKRDAESIVNNKLAALHGYLCSEITPRQIFDIIQPMRVATPAAADAALKRIFTIFEWAAANGAMDGKPNPAAMNGELRVPVPGQEHHPRS